LRSNSSNLLFCFVLQVRAIKKLFKYSRTKSIWVVVHTKQLDCEMLLFLFSLLFEASCHFQAAYMWHTSVATTRLLSDDVLRSNKPTTEKAWFSLFLSLSLSLFFFSVSLSLSFFLCLYFCYLSVSLSVSLSLSLFLWCWTVIYFGFSCSAWRLHSQASWCCL